MMQTDYAAMRRFKRYNVSNYKGLKSSSLESIRMKLVSISQGGCSFALSEIPSEFPEIIQCDFLQTNHEGHRVMARMSAERIYVRPLNSNFSEPEFLIGFRFEDEEQPELGRIMQDLESLAQKGSVPRA